MALSTAAGRQQAVEVVDAVATGGPIGRAGTGRALAPTPGGSRHPIKLGTPDEIRLEMARVYRDMKAGRIESQQGTRLVYVLGELRKAYETTVIDRRLKALEGAAAAPAHDDEESGDADDTDPA